MAILLLLLLPTGASAHTLPEHCEPGVGSVVLPPRVVRVWFDEVVDSTFSTIMVKDRDGKRVDNNDGRAASSRILEISVIPLKPGKYRVYWSVVTRDGHRTKGDYQFSVK